MTDDAHAAGRVCFTNWRGVTYVLCSIATKAGKTRLVASRTVVGTPLSAMPEGYEFAENVNGQVSVRRTRPPLIAVYSGESGRVGRMNPATGTGSKRPLKTAETGRGIRVKAAGGREDERDGAVGADGSGSGSGGSACANQPAGCGHVGNPAGVVQAAVGNVGNPKGCARCASTGVVHGRVMSMPHP